MSNSFTCVSEKIVLFVSKIIGFKSAQNGRQIFVVRVNFLFLVPGAPKFLSESLFLDG